VLIFPIIDLCFFIHTLRSRLLLVMSLHILRVQARLLKHTSRHLNLFYPFTRISPYRVTSILSNQLSDQRRWSQTSTIQIPLFVPTKPVSKEKSKY
jgi:hypothetical protein